MFYHAPQRHGLVFVVVCVFAGFWLTLSARQLTKLVHAGLTVKEDLVSSVSHLPVEDGPPVLPTLLEWELLKHAKKAF